jgi:hypothetical protein
MTWAYPDISLDRIILYDLYKINYSWPINGTLAGHWTLKEGMVFNLTQYKYSRRQDLRGIVYTAALVVSRPVAYALNFCRILVCVAYMRDYEHHFPLNREGCCGVKSLYLCLWGSTKDSNCSVSTALALVVLWIATLKEGRQPYARYTFRYFILLVRTTFLVSCFIFYCSWSVDSLVSAVTRLWDKWSEIGDRFPARPEIPSSSQRWTDSVVDPDRNSVDIRKYLLGYKRRQPEANHWPPTTAEVNNSWIETSTSWFLIKDTGIFTATYINYYFLLLSIYFIIFLPFFLSFFQFPFLSYFLLLSQEYNIPC